jgi:hypothetical protein
MIILLIIIGIGLFVSISGSSRQHYEDWREQQPPEVEHRIYPGHVDVGELVGCIVLAVIALVILYVASGGAQ